MSLTSENLVGYLLAEFAKASRLRKWIFVTQMLATVPAAVSVMVPESESVILYSLAVSGGVLLIIWALLNTVYQRARSAAHAARRAALLLGGLQNPLSTSAAQGLRARFTVSASHAQKMENSQYYATSEPPGSARLAAMLEESAIYSEELHRLSAKAMLALLMIFTLIATGIIVYATPFAARETALSVARIFLAILVFVLSSDVLGAWQRHLNAAADLESIRQRLMSADLGGYPQADVLLALTDYNAAIEGAPEIVPFVYAFNRKRLDERWRDYQADRAAQRDARL